MQATDITASRSKQNPQFTFVSGLETRRQKRFSSKTKNGCNTCKKRRIKCDEGKPVCANCKRGHRACEGYQSPKINQIESVGDESVLSLRSLPCVGLRYNSGSEDRCFHVYFNVSAKELAKFTNPYFWFTLVPQVSSSHESVKQALIAVNIAVEESDKAETKGLVASRALHHYNKSIRALTRSKDDSTPKDIVLICCVLFWLFENLKNRPNVAITHLRAAVRMLNERAQVPAYREDITSSYIEPLLQESMTLASTVLPSCGRPAHHAPTSTKLYEQTMNDLTPQHMPKDLHDARLGFARCEEALAVAKRMVISPKAPVPDMNLLRNLYTCWKTSFDHSCTTWPPDCVRLLNLHYAMHTMSIDIIQCELAGANAQTATTWRPHLERLLADARFFAVLEQVKGDNIINMSIISVLSFIARQSSEANADIAEEALAILAEYEIFEGIWSSRVAGELVRLMREADKGCESYVKSSLSDVLDQAVSVQNADLLF